MFRRPALCVLNAAFSEAAATPADRIVRPSRRARNELLCLSCLGPVLQTDLHAAWCPGVFVMDASPQKAALCMVEAPAPAVQEHSEQRGFYARLEGPATAALHEAGFES